VCEEEVKWWQRKIKSLDGVYWAHRKCLPLGFHHNYGNIKYAWMEGRRDLEKTVKKTENLKLMKVKRFVRDAIVSFAFWTGTLTPYMLFVVQINLPQYVAWISMQGILVPPLGAACAALFRWIDRRASSK